MTSNYICTEICKGTWYYKVVENYVVHLSCIHM